MAKLISKTYGEALFELAVEEEKIDLFLTELTCIRQVLDENEDFNKLMNHPKILKENKIEILTNVFKERISDELTGFLILVIMKDRYHEIDKIMDYFIMEVKKYKEIGVAYVTSAVLLNEIRKLQIEERLLETTSYKSMEMHYEVDASLIGGLVIRIGDRVMDSSVKLKLSELQKQLLKIQIS